MQHKHILRAVSACSLAVLLGGLPVRAEENMRFLGTLLSPPPCIINGGQMIEVNFGERLGVKQIDGVKYMQTVDYRLECDPGAGGAGLGLTLIANDSPLGRDVITTNLFGFGIRMMLNGQPFNLNQRVLIDAANPPVMQAVPVQKPDLFLTEGAFEGLATLLADYQ
ncbi:hypothetical protein D4100_22705 [Serratia inhibens]|uniref:Fimbrial-type adhesion domain-containing protein n=1 Tax=Serratia inhibens TaxID=2338073 RepID=A0AA93BUS5_9GAMM|nr:fimbrial protein [Serratia inhibens]RJF53295.1 hypothetical protein D4100_22705 [Serratia inhibens]